MELDEKGCVWNRTALESDPCEGDLALAGLLLAHGLVMNGGVEHALEVLSPAELEAAIAGFRYFTLDAVADLLAEASRGFSDDAEVEEVERRYGILISEDAVIGNRFEAVFALSPTAFAPVRRAG